MSYFDAYRNRLLSQGNSGTEAVENATINLINKNFSSSFGYRVVKVDQVDTDVIFSNGQENNDGELLFLPQYVPIRGSVVSFDNQDYLIVDTVKHEIYPTADIKLCNSKFPLPGSTVCNVVGQNDFGEDIEECTTSSPIEIPCIAETFFYKTGEDQAINLPEGQIKVTLPYTEHEAIALDKEFTMYNSTFKITGVDYTQSLNKIGLLIINAKRV